MFLSCYNGAYWLSQNTSQPHGMSQTCTARRLHGQYAQICAILTPCRGGLHTWCTHSPNTPSCWFQKFLFVRVQEQYNWSSSEVAIWVNMVLMLSTLLLGSQDWPGCVPWWDSVCIITTKHGCHVCTVPTSDAVCAYSHTWIPLTMIHVASPLSGNLTCTVACILDTGVHICLNGAAFAGNISDIPLCTAGV